MSNEISLEEIYIDAEDRMKKTVSVFEKELSKVRTGRASSSLVESIKVDYYNVSTPMNQVANVSVPEATTILIQPW
ncbi:MAG: ribosome-recycling factor, partial [Thermodesulfobacteriota bacterium]